MSVVGLDFGAQNTVIAAAGRGGVDVILNGNSNRLNPAMVGFGECRLMGEGASSKASSNFRNTVTNMKRLVGLAFDDPRAQAEMKRCFFTCVPIKHENGPDTIGVKVNDDQVVSVEAVAGMLVKHMGSIAAAKSASSSTSDSKNDTSLTDPTNPYFPQDWVISVPGYYTDAQKRALLSGCQIAGINGVQRLIHDTTATALAYGIFKDIKKVFNKENPSKVMFIDMGATSYSVSIVSFEPGKLIVKSSQHDPDLGGREFDKVIAEWIAEAFETKYKGKLSGKPMDRPKAAIKILSAAEKAKKTLSPAGVKEARINLECLMDDLDFSCALKAPEYKTMIEPLIARLAPPIERALAEAKIQASDLDSVEIVGGATRVGRVKEVLAGILGLDATATNCGLSTTMNADEAVCRGAALQSAILSPRFKVLPYEIMEYQPYPVKISWEGDIQQDGMEVEGDADGSAVPTNSVIMFERGSNFPSVRRVTLRRAGDFTVKASYDDSALLAGLSETASKEIATFTVKAPPGGENKIRVNVKQDVHGTTMLSSAQMVEEYEEDVPVPAAEAKEGEEAKKEEPKVEKKKKMKKTNLQFTTVRPIDFTKAEIDTAFEIEVAMSNADRLVRETSDMRNALESYIYDMRDKITLDSQLGPYCTEDEKAKFSAALESDENWLYEDGFDASKAVYAEKLRELNKIGNPIVARQYEAGARPNAVAILQRTAEKYKNWLNTTANEEKNAHITAEEKSTCHAKCDEVTAWMYDMLDKQGSLSLSDDPAVTVNDINAKSKELADTVSPIMHKPVPKPKKTEEKKAEEAPPAAEKADDTKPADDAAAPEPMETD
mmetsp:Transcript_24643/g.31412  ORF Transcript_24643/g.31412 Transcript_24643/m.31412 type:complete len:832 (+) Transcript_24643:88-2583(+)